LAPVLRLKVSKQWSEAKALATPGTRLNAGIKCDLTAGRHKSAELSMKRSVLLFAACLWWPAAAFSQTKAPSPQEFATKVAISDMMEIQAAKLALSKEPDSDTKPFAERMVKDHAHTLIELKALVGSGKVNVALPTALDAEHQREIDELEVKSGKEFDRAYDPMQVKAHERAVQLFEAYARNGDNPDLKAWAAKTLPHLKQHLAMAKKLTS
jgi:putative membrane protein